MADFLGFMKQAAELKSKMEAMQAELENLEVEGASGGGLVTVRLSGKGEMRAVNIDETLIKPSEKEIVQDLILAAHTDALLAGLEDFDPQFSNYGIASSQAAEATDLLRHPISLFPCLTCITFIILAFGEIPSAAARHPVQDNGARLVEEIRRF